MQAVPVVVNALEWRSAGLARARLPALLNRPAGEARITAGYAGWLDGASAFGTSEAPGRTLRGELGRRAGGAHEGGGYLGRAPRRGRATLEPLGGRRGICDAT